MNRVSNSVGWFKKKVVETIQEINTANTTAINQIFMTPHMIKSK